MTRPQTAGERKLRGAFATPPSLVQLVVDHNMPDVVPGTTVRALDPACGDGRFLVAAGHALRLLGARPELHGIDIDSAAVAAAESALVASGFEACVEQDDALRRPWGDATYDVVIGNPPYLSQMAAATTRGGASEHGGGPYADACAEFLALAVRLARPDGGRVALVLPQSILAARDAGAVRDEVDRLAEMTWSWWSPHQLFDANVYVCALGFTRRACGQPGIPTAWPHVVTAALGVPDLPPLATEGTLGDRATLSADFRDAYYGLVPAVVDAVDEEECGGRGAAPPLVTSGLVDPGRCRWGERPVRFARRRLQHPRVRLDHLTPTMQRWAEQLLVPKVLIANQTRVVEAIADPGGTWLPGVPLLTARPTDHADVTLVAAMLTSPVASAWVWHQAAGSGLSATSVRLGPRWLAGLPWPAGTLQRAEEALAGGDVAACGGHVMAAYALDPSTPAGAALLSWWADRLPRHG